MLLYSSFRLLCAHRGEEVCVVCNKIINNLILISPKPQQQQMPLPIEIAQPNRNHSLRFVYLLVFALLIFCLFFGIFFKRT